MQMVMELWAESNSGFFGYTERDAEPTIKVDKTTEITSLCTVTEVLPCAQLPRKLHNITVKEYTLSFRSRDSGISNEEDRPIAVVTLLPPSQSLISPTAFDLLSNVENCIDVHGRPPLPDDEDSDILNDEQLDITEGADRITIGGAI